MNPPNASTPMIAHSNEGRREGLAIAAVAIAAVAFLNLLGIEKAILAAVLGFMALRDSPADSKSRRIAKIALIIAAIYACTYVVVMIAFRETLAELIRLIYVLG